LSDKTPGHQNLYQPFVSPMIEIRVIDAVIETSDSTSVLDPNLDVL
jgi:hypothetical protein